MDNPPAKVGDGVASTEGVHRRAASGKCVVNLLIMEKGANVVKSSAAHAIAFIGAHRTVTTIFFAAATDSLLP